MIRFLVLLCVAGLAGTAAYAQSASTPPATDAAVLLSADQRLAVLDLLSAMQAEQVLNGQLSLLIKSQEKAQAQMLAKAPAGASESKAKLANSLTEARQFYQKSMGWDAVKEDMIQAYGSTFTIDELRSLAAFYRSDVGQLFLRKQPEASRLMAAAAQRRNQALAPEIQRIMDAHMKRNNSQKATPKMPGQ